MLFTGDKPGSNRQRTVCDIGRCVMHFSESAKLDKLILTITRTFHQQQIQIGTYGHLCTVGTNNYGPYGTLYAVLPVRGKPDVTPRVDARAAFCLHVHAHPYQLVSIAWRIRQRMIHEPYRCG